MPRSKSFDREEVVKKAMKLFWEKGYESTSLNDLTEHLGIGKGSFYATFDSKESLFHECIKAYTNSNFPLLDEALQSAVDFRTGLRKLLEDYVDGMINDPENKGCFMANSCSLVHQESFGMEAIISEHYHKIEAYLSLAMQADGISPSKAQSIAKMIITFLIGVSQQSKINKERSAYILTLNHILSPLDAD